MTDSKIGKWPTKNIQTSNVLLDPQNPRIDCSLKTTQDNIRLLLLETEDVLSLANSIVKMQGNMAGEKLIVIHEDGKDVVVEGNRRACACQLLTNPALVPSRFLGRMPAISDALKIKLSTLEADVAPSRVDAEPIITRRHTEPGIEKWSPSAKHRRIVRLKEEGHSIDDIADQFGMSSRAPVLAALKEYNLLAYTKGLSCWDKGERAALNSPILAVNPFTRFFTLKGVKDKLGIVFDSDGNMKFKKDKKMVKEAFIQIAKQLLVPNPETGKTPMDTRATAANVFSKVAASNPELKKFFKQSLLGRQNGKPVAKHDVFFKTLKCRIQDNHLLKLTDEISTINYAKYSTAATFLLRALLERTLRWCIEQKNLTPEFINKYEKGRHSTLKELIGFTLDKSDAIFIDSKSAKSILNEWSRSKKNVIDLIIHAKYLEADEKHLESVSNFIRAFIQKILDAGALK